MSKPRVLLTGATGLIGRQTIVPLKNAGFDVIALSRSGGAVADTTEALKCNLLDPLETTNTIKITAASHLVHLAWHDHPADRWSSPANLDWAAASLNLVRAFAQAGGTRVVAAGSCAEYDWSQSSVFAETSPLAPGTLYGAAKSATGSLLTAAAPSLGLSLAWARIFFCYGPGEVKGRLVGDLISGISAGRTVNCTDGKQKRDFLHTADIGRALALIAASSLDGPVNVASGHAIEVREIIEATARKLGRPDRVKLGALPRAADDPLKIEADTSRLHGLGFRPRFDLESGLDDVISQSATR